MCWNKGRLCWKITKLFYFCHLKKLVRPETFGPYYVYFTATRYFNSKYTLYSGTATNTFLLYISCLYTLYIVTITSIWPICQLEVYIIQRDNYEYMAYMSARSVHYTAGQLQIHDFYMSAVCIHYISSQLRVCDSYISAICTHYASWQLRLYDLCVSSKYTLYSGTVTNAWLLYISCKYTFYSFVIANVST